jgi:hypothetical protein
MAAQVGRILGEISEDEVSNGRPMLSAIAVSLEGKPSHGFYVLARDLDKLSAAENDPHFWKIECEAVYNCWKAE